MRLWCLSSSDGSGLAEAVGDVWVVGLEVKSCMALGTFARVRLGCSETRETEAKVSPALKREYLEEDAGQHMEEIEGCS